MAAMTYDRREQDLGNILFLEHVNVRVPDQQAATLFYIAGLGLTRDPYLMVSVDNMWANAGQTQFHLPTGKPNVLQGHVELIVPDLEALTRRLAAVKPALAGTAFGYEVRDKHVAVTCPWGNQFRCVGPGPEWGDITLGIGRVEVPVARGAAAGIAAFYQQALRATASVTQDDHGAAARVSVGYRQELVFRETAAASGLNANLVAGANNGFLSGWQLDSNTAASGATLQLRLWGLARRADNAFGASAKWLVTINNHELAIPSAGV